MFWSELDKSICYQDWSVGKHDYSKRMLKEADAQNLRTVVGGMLIFGAMLLHARKIEGYYMTKNSRAECRSSRTTHCYWCVSQEKAHIPVVCPDMGGTEVNAGWSVVLQEVLTSLGRPPEQQRHPCLLSVRFTRQRTQRPQTWCKHGGQAEWHAISQCH